MYRTLSWRNIPTAKTLFVMIFMAGIGLIMSIVALLYLSLHLISTKTNEIDEHRTALSVQGAIQTSVNRVSSLVMDNAVWDDAVRGLPPKLDTEWLYNTWARALKSIISMTAPLCWMNISTSCGDRFRANPLRKTISFWGRAESAD
jgi:hypothetical protein